MEPEIIKFEDIIRGCIKKWKTILVFAICTSILATVILGISNDTITYEGNFKVFVKNESILDENGNVIKKDNNLIQNYIELMKTRNFVGNSLERVDLNLKAQEILPRLSIANIDKSDFIQVKYSSEDEMITQKVLEAMKDELIVVGKSYNEDAEISIEEDIAISEKVDIKSNKLIIIIGFIGGLAIAFVLTFILECINKTFRTKGELERELKLPVIANIPKVREELPIIKESSNSVIVESYNSLATDIKFGNKNKNIKSISVTSSIEGEGSTTTAINLALALSNSNKTVLIDADFKKPSIAKMLELKEGKGLTEVILEDSKLEEVVSSVNNNLDVLLSGRNSSNSISLLDSKEFDKLLSKLYESYDYIIIDTPPLQAIADTKILCKKTDGMILVVKAEFVEKDIVKSSIENINKLGSKLVGIVFNCGDMFRNKYYKY